MNCYEPKYRIFFSNIIQTNMSTSLDLHIYYSQIHCGFFAVHAQNSISALVSGCCKYFTDAHTATDRYLISTETLKRWVKIDKNDIKSYQFLDLELEDNYQFTLKAKGGHGSYEEKQRRSWDKSSLILKKGHKCDNLELLPEVTSFTVDRCLEIEKLSDKKVRITFEIK